jgi:eukaryotic-like serine/threonine-protein kinase
VNGQIISHYRILEKLGAGSLGVVYKAEHTELGRIVALKLIPSQAPEIRARFIREAQAAAAVSHPNLCTLFEIDQENGFMATEFVDGGSVAARIKASPLPLPEALDIAMQACQGLAAAHAKGIVHRDIKPANLMLTSTGQVKIVDFGLAHIADRPRITQTGATLGTPAYTGRRPFSGESGAVLAHGIIHKTPAPLAAMRAALPPELERIVEKALAKDRGERYQSAEDLLVDLRQVRATPPPRPRGMFFIPWAVGAAVLAAAAYWLIGILRNR